MTSSLRSLSDTLSPAQSIPQHPDYDDGDGFEVIGSHPSDSICFSEGGGTFCNELERGNESEILLPGNESVTPQPHLSLHPSIAFTLVHETEQLRASLEKHKEELEVDLSNAKEMKIESDHKIKDLEEKMDYLNRDLLLSNEDKQEMAVQLSDYEKCKNHRDEILASNFQKDEEINYYKKMFNQLKAEGGFVNVHPPMLTDAVLAKELQEREQALDEEKKARICVEKELNDMKEREDLLIKDNSELREMVSLMNEQIHEYRTDIDVLKQRYSSRLSNLEENATGGTEEGNKRFQCENCLLVVPDQSLFDRHRLMCNGFNQHT